VNPVLQAADDLLTQQAAQIATLEKQANTKVFDNLELTPWLLAPGTAANTGSTGSSATATQGQPGVSCAWFKLAPKGPYANGYWYNQLGADATRTSFTYDLRFMFGTAIDAAASQAVELDIQQVIGGVVYNMGWQFDFADNALRVWNRSGKTWVKTGKPCLRWIQGQWIHILAEQHRIGGNVIHDAITINGLRLPIDMSFPAPTLGLNDMLNCAIQLDGNKAGATYQIYLDAIKFNAGVL